MLGAQRLDAQAHAVDGARHLDPRIDQRLAAFARRLDGQRLGAPGHDLLRLVEYLDAPVGRQPALPIEGQPGCRRQCRLDDRGVGRRHGGDGGAVIGRVDLDDARPPPWRPAPSTDTAVSLDASPGFSVRTPRYMGIETLPRRSVSFMFSP